MSNLAEIFSMGLGSIVQGYHDLNRKHLTPQEIAGLNERSLARRYLDTVAGQGHTAALREHAQRMIDINLKKADKLQGLPPNLRRVYGYAKGVWEAGMELPLTVGLIAGVITPPNPERYSDSLPKGMIN